MNVLLLSMPDSFEHMPPVAVRMPNGALAALAGNIDPHHSVAIADLILARHEVRSTVERLLNTHAPDVIGLSVMTFQRETALQIAQLVNTIRPNATIVAGGYDPTLAPEAYECTRKRSTSSFGVKESGRSRSSSVPGESPAVRCVGGDRRSVVPRSRGVRAQSGAAHHSARESSTCGCPTAVRAS